MHLCRFAFAAGAGRPPRRFRRLRVIARLELERESVVQNLIGAFGSWKAATNHADSPPCSDGSTPGIPGLAGSLGVLPIALDIAFLPNHYACPEETPAELFVHLQQNLSL